MEESLKEKTAKGLFWGGLSNGAQQVLNLVFGIFLARLLDNEDYGMVGMLSIFSFIAASLQEGGFIYALNRKKDATHKDFNAVFWTCSIVSLSIYFILFFCAPLIANYYNEQRLVPLSRYIFIGFFITSLGIAPRAILFRNMKVKQASINSFISLLISGIIGVAMAACGFAYWGIATQTLVYVSLFTGINFYFSKWHPTFSFDFSPIHEMFGFSSKIIITNIVTIINANIFSVILGRMYSAHIVGNYTQANKWNNMGWSLINNMLNGISQPVFAKTNDDKERQKRIFRKLLRFTAFVSFPAMLGLALVAKEFIVLLLGEKWFESAVLLQILCVMGAFYPITYLFSNLLVSRGHSSTYMWCNIGLCIVQLAAVFFSSGYGIENMLKVYVTINILWLFVWHYYAKSEINIKLTEVLKDISPYFAISTVFIYMAHLLTVNLSNLFLSFIVKCLFVSSTYCLSLWLLKSTIFREALHFIKDRKQEI